MPFKLRSTLSRTASLLTKKSSNRRDLILRLRRRQRKRLSEKCNARRHYSELRKTWLELSAQRSRLKFKWNNRRSRPSNYPKVRRDKRLTWISNALLLKLDLPIKVLRRLKRPLEVLLASLLTLKKVKIKIKWLRPPKP